MQTIYLDISNRGIIPCIQAKQGEVGRKFLAIITDNGLPFNIPDDTLISVWYEGSTDAGNYSSIDERSAFEISENKVSVELIAQMLFKPGDGEMCLSMTSGDGKELNTWNIPYSVERKPGSGSFVPTEYYTALTEAGKDAAKYATQARNAANEATDAVVGYLKLDGTRKMTGNLDMNNNKIQNVSKPSLDGDAVNLSYLKSVITNTLVPIGYTFHWSPVSNSEIDLSTPEKVNQHFGFGEWEQIKDRFLIGAGDNYSVGTTGGESTHTITTAEMPSHFHDGITIDALAGSNIMSYAAAADRGAGSAAFWKLKDGTVADDWTARTVEAGGGEPMDIMPPYISTYIWKRIK